MQPRISTDESGSPATVALLLALSAGLLAGLTEAALTLAIKLRGGWVYAGPHLGWMAPVADAMTFLPVALLLVLAQRVWPRLAAPHLAAFVFVSLGSWSVSLVVPGVSVLAGTILAVGLGVQGARFALKYPHRLGVALRASCTFMAALIMILAASTYLWQWSAERLAMARLSAAAPNAPNVLLIVLDTVRAQSLSLYGYARRTTPTLEQLAERATVFDMAFATAPWTLPSHASILTGRWPHELSTDWSTPLDDGYATLAEALSARGYRTAGFVANRTYGSYETGLSRGFARYEDYTVSLRDVLRSSPVVRFVVTSQMFREAAPSSRPLGPRSAAAINASFLRWVEADDRPFFAFLNYFDAHTPYLPPEVHLTRFGPERPDRDPLKLDGWLFSGHSLSKREIDAERDAYDGAISYLDEQLRLLVDALRTRGVFEDTLVIITSDHGDQIGEHGLFNHANSLYGELLHVPLLISFPGRLQENVRVREPVSLREIPATVLDLVQAGSNDVFPGRSLEQAGRSVARCGAPPVLAAVARSHVSHRPGLPNTKGPMHALVAEGRHYIRNGDGREELYDLGVDPAELVDLSASQEPTLERFRSLSDRVLNRQSAVGQNCW